jgi:hypothetical protein
MGRHCRPMRCWPPTRRSAGGRRAAQGRARADGLSTRARLPGPGRRQDSASRPRATDAATTSGGPSWCGSGSGAAGGFAAGSLTGPLDTAAGLADRPGELSGPGRPGWPATWPPPPRAPNDWCVTVTDQHGHAVGHAARPEPKSHRTRAGPAPGGRPGSPSPRPPGRPPGGYGTWRLRIPGTGRT